MPRPSFKPTEEQQRVVKTMAMCNMRHELIAVALDITPKTLRKHCPQGTHTGTGRGALQNPKDSVWHGNLRPKYCG